MIGKCNIEGELFCFFVVTILTAFGASMLLCLSETNIMVGIAMALLVVFYVFFCFYQIVEIADKIIKTLDAQ